MLTLDAQVHTYEKNHPGRPWLGHLPGPDEATGPQMVAALDAAGVQGAVLVASVILYGYDPSYAEAVYDAYPDRFRLVKPVDPGDPGVGETVAHWAGRPGVVGVRLMLTPHGPEDPADPGLALVLGEAARRGLAVNIYCPGRLGQVAALAARHPDTNMVIDHLGLFQPKTPPVPAEPFADLPALLALAAFPNVSVKISGACTMARGPYPYRDLWDPIHRIFDAFGLERCPWGTDWTRSSGMLLQDQTQADVALVKGMSPQDRLALLGETLERRWVEEGAAPSRATREWLSYRLSVEAFRVMDRLSESDRATLMAGALMKIYGWSEGARRAEKR